MWPVVITLSLPRGRDLPITSYGLVFVIAFGLIAIVAPGRARRIGLAGYEGNHFLALALVGGLLGARAAFLAFNVKQLVANPIEVLGGQGGLVWYGGVAGGALTTILYARHYQIPLPVLFDLAAPLVALGHGLGRIGCFLSGCCYGAPTSLPWGVHFPASAYYRGPVGVSLHPVQLYEAIFELSLGAALWVWGRQPRGGKVLVAYLAAYAPFRFAMEILFRGDDRGTLGFPVPPSAALSILALGIAGFLALRFKSATALPH